jgi:hypothetical protein
MSEREEQWRAIPGFEGTYEVSDGGRVRSIDRVIVNTIGRRHALKGKILKPFNNRGWFTVGLYRPEGARTLRVHQAVLMAFVGPRPDGYVTRHLDGDKSNNSLENLVWGTQLENINDRRVHGTAQWALNRGACVHGHPWTEENTRFRDGHPLCRTCIAARQRVYHLQRKVRNA